jgi:hypothetical protein
MNHTGFLDITSIHLPKSCAISALGWMHKMGKSYLEGVALWAGVRKDDKFYIKRTIIPEQKSGSFDNGLLYVVEGKELHRIGLELFDTGMQLIAQIHSHPKAAYHSETDDEYPIVTVLGGISVVVPDFAQGGFNLSQWAVYRFLPYTKWTALTEENKKSLIQIIDDSP